MNRYDKYRLWEDEDELDILTDLPPGSLIRSTSGKHYMRIKENPADVVYCQWVEAERNRLVDPFDDPENGPYMVIYVPEAKK